MIAEQARKLLVMLESYDGISKDHSIKKELNQFLQNIHPDKENFYLAKGEMRGMRGPFFRSRHALLQGVGFNYDFEDDEGPSRDLRSGKPINQTTAEEIALVKKGDVLMTTGMDGIFPAGLRVGQVTQVHPLREGGSAYELDALPLIGNFDNISFVAVLPPLDSNQID
jgi:hypothetical protein